MSSVTSEEILRCIKEDTYPESEQVIGAELSSPLLSQLQNALIEARADAQVVCLLNIRVLLYTDFLNVESDSADEQIDCRRCRYLDQQGETGSGRYRALKGHCKGIGRARKHQRCFASKDCRCQRQSEPLRERARFQRLVAGGFTHLPGCCSSHRPAQRPCHSWPALASINLVTTGGNHHAHSRAVCHHKNTWPGCEPSGVCCSSPHRSGT